MTEKVIAGADSLRAWAQTLALPLWADAGFDRQQGCFQEQLTFERTPVLSVPRRSMVQARQISVYAHAALLGWFPEGADMALQAADNLIARYGRDSGAGGFTFAIDQNGTATDGRFDLYAQAFVLFALAWAIKLDSKAEYRRTVDRLLAFLDTRYHDGAAGGYFDQDPRTDQFRRQNPHMHMFEALVELHVATGDDRYLDRLGSLRALCENRFCDAPAGVVHELYDENWRVAAPIVEPGHQMEWSWLLCRHDRVLGQKSEFADRLFQHAVAHGLDKRTGRVRDEITAMGGVLKASSRCWPHTEAAKALVIQHERRSPGCLELLAPVLHRLRAVYAIDELRGGWVDHVDAADRPLSAIMPASTFYHVFLAITETARMLGPREASNVA